MRWFIYIGDGAAAPNEVTAFGLSFAKGGDPVVVLDDHVAQKLAGNSSFQEVVPPVEEPTEPVYEETGEAFEEEKEEEEAPQKKKYRR